MKRRYRPSTIAGCLILGGALGLGAVTACSSSSNGDPGNAVQCPSDLPPACPAQTPSFAKDIQPIFERRCWGCHAGSGVAISGDDFSTYASIFSNRTVILNRVYGCVMPPPDAGQPTPEERAAFLAWFVCKAPNN
jgi:hypothetical protein